MLRKFVVALAAAGMVWVSSESSAQEKADTMDEQAKKVSMQFAKALLMDMDVDAIMKLVAVPSIQREVKKDDFVVIRDLGDLKKHFAKLVDGHKPLKGQLEFVEMSTYGQMLTKKGELPPEMRKKFDEVLKKTDRIVEVRLPGDKSEAHVAVLVGWRDGQAKVVGYTLGFTQKSTKPK